MLPCFQIELVRKKKKHSSKYSSSRRDVKPHFLAFSTSGQRRQRRQRQDVLYMRSEDCKEISRFRLPSWDRRRLLLKVPINKSLT